MFRLMQYVVAKAWDFEPSLIEYTVNKVLWMAWSTAYLCINKLFKY